MLTRGANWPRSPPHLLRPTQQYQSPSWAAVEAAQFATRMVEIATEEADRNERSASSVFLSSDAETI